MQNQVTRAICILFLFTFSYMGDMLSISSAIKMEYPPKYEYRVNLGEDLIFNIDFNATGGFSNNSVYQEIDRWISQYAESTDNEKLKNFSNSQGLIADFFQLIAHHIRIKVNVSKIKRVYENKTLPNYDRISRGFDEITGSLLIWEPVNQTWITPFTYFHSQIDLIRPFFLNHFNIAADDYDLNDLINDAHAYIDTEFGTTYWLNYVIERFQTSEDYYYANGTKRPPELAPDYDPQLPKPPLDLLNLTGIPFVLPASMSFQTWADYASELVEYSSEHPNNTIPMQSLSNLLDQGGITTFITNTHGLGAILVSQAINMSFINLFLSQSVEELETLFAITEWASVISFALEYDDNFVLASLTAYCDSITEYNTIPKIINGSDLPYINRESFVLSSNLTCVQEGCIPPTLDQIQNGEIGDNRNYRDTSTTSSTHQISGFTLYYLGLVMIAVVIILLLRTKFTPKRSKNF